MTGYWLSCDGGEVAENWIGAGAGVLLGTNLTQGEQDSFEFLRIAANGRGGPRAGRGIEGVERIRVDAAADDVVARVEDVAGLSVRRRRAG